MAKAKPSAFVDTRVIYCGDNLDQLRKLPDACVNLIYIDPPFNSNRNYEVFWGETKEKRSFEDRHESTRAYLTTLVCNKCRGSGLARTTPVDAGRTEQRQPESGHRRFGHSLDDRVGAVMHRSRRVEIVAGIGAIEVVIHPIDQHLAWDGGGGPRIAGAVEALRER